MQLGSIKMTIDVKFKNARAVRAFACVVRALAEQADRYPFDADLRKAVRAGRFVLKHMTVDTEPENSGG